MRAGWFRRGAAAVLLLASQAIPPCAHADADAATDAIFLSSFESDAAAQIALARSLPDGAASVPVPSALVTYLKPALGTDSAGFFVQGNTTGPALFIAVDPAGLNPAPQKGDRVSFTITAMGTVGGLREATGVTGYTREATGVSLAGLVQDLSTAADVVSGLDGYESELVAITGVIGSGFAAAGAGHVSARIDTVAVALDAQLQIRLPSSVASALDLGINCMITVQAVPMWRFNAAAQVSPYFAADFAALDCPPPTVTQAVALSSTSVRVDFSRNILVASVSTDGSQFLFDNGLVASSASVSGNSVTLTTSSQSPGTGYVVNVANTVTDTAGTPVGNPNSAGFTGFLAPATLLLNEVAPNNSLNFDSVELRATAAGTIAGIELVQGPDAQGGGTVLATMPNTIVAAGDLIVVHLNPLAGTTDETAGKTDCADATCYPGAWDVRGGAAGVTFSDQVLALRRSNGTLTDAVAFARPAGADRAAFPGEVQFVAGLGQWSIAACGSPCDYASTPSVIDISVDWSSASSNGSITAQRVSAGDSNTNADWTVKAQTMGAAN